MTETSNLLTLTFFSHLRQLVRSVLLKVCGIAPLGAILNGKWAKKQRGRQGGETK